MAFTSFMRDQPTRPGPGGYLATENTQKPQEVAHLFSQVVPDAQLYKKMEA